MVRLGWVVGISQRGIQSRAFMINAMVSEKGGEKKKKKRPEEGKLEGRLRRSESGWWLVVSWLVG